ncbi:hypothetical protein AUC47_04910 [Microbacterium sp. SZ1]|uniref:phage gp6-like head-tail connector protein n=1 Tax=Microbacterium sp. SZ1 TaxID=1849736 RepID=UPI000BBC2C8F|nr:phage gp6-like head-tail connector protein [Microbacterium sp. SZ1]PCE13991.1 hypothetical protein AUC47_04910 [Microbacterium sp. SZ1]
MATTKEKVRTWMQLQGNDQDAHVTVCVEAVNAFIGGLPVIADRATDAEWPKQVDLAATMLAARLVRRRNSPSGVEAMTEAGTSYVSRYDPDIARMLELDGYERPAIA